MHDKVDDIIDQIAFVNMQMDDQKFDSLNHCVLDLGRRKKFLDSLGISITDSDF